MADLLLPRLRPDQWAIAEHPAKVKLIAAGRRWGKTVMAGDIALAAASQGGKVAWVVPTYRNSRPLWRWAEAAVGPLRAAREVDVSRQEHVVQFPRTGGFLGIYSADNDTGIRGEWFNTVILDEAARIDEATWEEVIWPTLADADGDALLISTPAGKDWFWRLWRQGVAAMDGEFASWTAPSHDNPSPRIQRAAQLAKERIPDRAWRQEWNAEFVTDAETIWDLAWFEAARYDASADTPRLNLSCVARWISVDTAFSDHESAAYSAAIVGELTPDYRLRIRSVWRDRVTFPPLLTQLQQMATTWGADYRVPGERRLRGLIIEDKASGISASQTLRETSEPWLASLVQPFQPKGTKEQRAELAAVWAQQGCILLPAPSAAVSWLANFEAELEGFPSGANNDQVDAFSQLILYTSRYLRQGLEARQRAARVLVPAPLIGSEY